MSSLKIDKGVIADITCNYNCSDATIKILNFSFNLLEAQKSLKKSDYIAKIEAMGFKKNSPALRTHLKIAQAFSEFKYKTEILKNILPITIYKLTQKRYTPVLKLLLCSKVSVSQTDVENMMSQVRDNKKTTSRGWNTDNKGNKYLKTETSRIYDEQAGEALLHFEKAGSNRKEIIAAALKIAYKVSLDSGKSLQEINGESNTEEIKAENHPPQSDNTEEAPQTWKEFQINISRNRLIRDNLIPNINSNIYQSVTKLACQAKEYSELIKNLGNQEYNSHENEIFKEAIINLKNERDNCIDEAKTIACDAGYEIIEEKLASNNELVWKCAPDINTIASEKISAVSPIKYRNIFQPEEILKKAINQEISWKSIKKALYRIYEFTHNNPHNFLESVLSQLDNKTKKSIREIFPKSLSKLNHSLNRGQIYDYIYLLPLDLVLIRYSEQEQEIVSECLVEKRLSNITRGTVNT
ncbi:MAG: hypothetical protein AAF378_00645 [Cyanobacteria bacterium P01_A01_bin.84]